GSAGGPARSGRVAVGRVVEVFVAAEFSSAHERVRCRLPSSGEGGAGQSGDGLTRGAVPFVLRRLDAKRARILVGTGKKNGVRWTEETPRRAGKEMLLRGMFPPRRYFKESAA